VGGLQSAVGLQSHGLIIINLCLHICALSLVICGEADETRDMVGSMGNGYCPLKPLFATTAHPVCRHCLTLYVMWIVCAFTAFSCACSAVLIMTVRNQVGWLNGSQLVK